MTTYQKALRNFGKKFRLSNGLGVPGATPDEKNADLAQRFGHFYGTLPERLFHWLKRNGVDLNDRETFALIFERGSKHCKNPLACIVQQNLSLANFKKFLDEQDELR